MGKVIVVASGKGGTGKTTTVGAISSCLAALGHRTLCIDCDVGLKNLDIILGMTDFAVTDFADVLEGNVLLDNAYTAHPRIENLNFLTAPSIRGPEGIDRTAMVALTAEIREKFDYCLIDSPAGLGPGFRLAACGADMAIIVTTGDTSSIRDGQRVTEELRAMGVADIRLLANRVRPALFRRVKATVDDIIDTVGARLIGLIQEDEAVILAANMETPLVLYKNKGAARQFLRTAQRINGKDIPLTRI